MVKRPLVLGSLSLCLRPWSGLHCVCVCTAHILNSRPASYQYIAGLEWCIWINNNVQHQKKKNDIWKILNHEATLGQKTKKNGFLCFWKRYSQFHTAMRTFSRMICKLKLNDSHFLLLVTWIGYFLLNYIYCNKLKPRSNKHFVLTRL
jgi:hypothetical protein